MSDDILIWKDFLDAGCWLQVTSNLQPVAQFKYLQSNSLLIHFQILFASGNPAIFFSL